MAHETKKPRRGRKPLAPSKKRDSVLKLKFRDEDSPKLDDAAELDKLETNPWARQKLLIVAEHRIAGMRLEVAYSLAMEKLSKDNPSAYEKIRAALDAALHKRGSEK